MENRQVHAVLTFRQTRIDGWLGVGHTEVTDM